MAGGVLRWIEAIEGEGALEIVGLKSAGGLEIVGAGSISRAVLRGPAVALLAGAPVVLIPAWPALPDELPAPELVEVLGGARGEGEDKVARDEGTTLTLKDLRCSAAGEPSTEVIDAAGTFSINTADEHATFRVSERELSMGIVLGRYDRCDLTSAGVTLAREVSRVHALILRDGDRLTVYDTASTNGLLVERESTLERRRVLSFDLERTASFYLGDSAGVVFRPSRAR